MQARRKTWGDVRQDGIIRSKEGVVFKVVRINMTHVGLRTRDGESKIIKRPAATAPVDIMHLTQLEAEEMLRDQLGAELYAIKYDGEGVWKVTPFDNRKIQEMKSHLLIFHGVSSTSANDPGNSAGMNSKKALIECHNEQHASPGPRWTPHVHVSENEVSWT